MSNEEKFKSILASNAFDQLRPYAEPLSWNGMTSDERAMLGLLFVKQGEQLLKGGDLKAMESFELASKVAPHSVQVFFKQAVAYLSQGMNIRSLKAAERALEKTTELDPDFIHAWSLWGDVLSSIGAFYGDISYMHQALEKFEAAKKLSIQFDSLQLASVYWHGGICLYQIGKHSGEAIDMVAALEKFRAAAQAGCTEGQFYNDYGNVLIDLASLIGRKDLLDEAADIYLKASKILPNQYEVWTNLACTHKNLYEIGHAKENFQLADDYFASATKLNPDHAMSWFHWGGLYLYSGKHLRDLAHLKVSLEKFAQAHFCEEDLPQILLLWGEAQLLAASHAEDLEQLKQAEAKIATALDGMPSKPEAWYMYGLCMEAYGRYFSQESYYLAAIEKYEQALSLDAARSPAIRFLLLNALATIYFERGEMGSNPKLMVQSIDYFQQASSLTGLINPYFMNDWGIALLKLGELTGEKEYIEQALHKFEETISKGFESTQGEVVEVEWLYNYGCSLDFLGDYHEDASYYERAIQVLSHVLKVDPEYSDAKYNLAMAYSHLGELNADVDSYQHALELFQKLSEEDPEDDLVWNDYGYCLLNLATLIDDPAGCQEAKSIFANAEKKFLQAAALGNLGAFYQLACLHACTNNFPTALFYLERAEQSHALPSAEEMLNDHWLDNLRNHPSYRALISRLLGGLAP